MNTWTICGQAVACGEKKQIMLTADIAGCEMPAVMIKGQKPGKTVLITAAVHGDEYPGIIAAIRAANEIDSAAVTGQILIIPCVNTAGFWAGSRYVPSDGANLNANYPGKTDGTAGERIADFFVRHIFPQTDFIIDLHSGSAMEPLTPCLFFPDTAGDVVRQAAKAAAYVTDIPYLIASTAATGHYSYAASALKIPGLLLERGHSGLCEDSWVEAYYRDIRLLLRHLAVYPYEDNKAVCPKKVFHKTIYLSAAHAGLWFPVITANAAVKEGDLLGRMEDFFGNTIAEYRAQADGTVFYYRGGLAVKQGQELVAYGLERYAE
ncbi:M14 family metallopeptidase [Sporomusa sphaeroides]|uniref:Succinylglutamate desuccinylase / Aspartoacylase family protein n=2 Tax=Sporomusa TaxID=2375 RepID=A0ABP2C5B0_9FIRM|nr:M14 family metallopeptidase [Sporomusa sphaeroides]OLS56784.1 N-alpha-acetyl-L-2,4-diaminobutyric acid deacetylase [Sporomusa sphaeroides DSM 2875]CVK18731.1 Succinylglutamate desuccinylase / Aspartoacylase family protein [Sporomusa sphaeroides DSM 2875]SCM81952.1 Succinylglutamate desuccinylase/aspartoacylase [uncultured Sporomusa sp.]